VRVREWGGNGRLGRTASALAASVVCAFVAVAWMAARLVVATELGAEELGDLFRAPDFDGFEGEGATDLGSGDYDLGGAAPGEFLATGPGSR
jgi:hypothetical protein